MLEPEEPETNANAQDENNTSIQDRTSNYNVILPTLLEEPYLLPHELGQHVQEIFFPTAEDLEVQNALADIAAQEELA